MQTASTSKKSDLNLAGTGIGDAFRLALEMVFGPQLATLVVKEFQETIANRYLLFLILIPPTVQLLILGASLDPQVRHLHLGMVDHSRSVASKQVQDLLKSGDTINDIASYKNEDLMANDLKQGKIAAGLVFPQDFSKKVLKDSAPVQILIDGADAYSGTIARGFILNQIYKLEKSQSSPSKMIIRNDADSRLSERVDILYNPEQKSPWYFVPGVLGACLTLIATLIASASILKEREKGTMEQLLMTPSDPWQILLAKVIPLLTFLLIDVLLAVYAARYFFGMPLKGSLILLLLASSLYGFVGIGFGLLLGSLCSSQRQAQLSSFFVNIPLILLSGSVVPLDTLPDWVQAIAILDPLRYYTICSRGIILKGIGLDYLWHELTILTVFALVLLFVSAKRFERHLT